MTRIAIPCLYMRGGSSKGPYIDLSHLPATRVERDHLLLRIMGSPDKRQIDGIGGAEFLTSKLAMVGRSKRDGIDVDYLFAQIIIDEPIVDTSPPCGNMLAGVAPFAIETGLVQASDPVTSVSIYNVNTSTSIDATVQTPGGIVEYDGQTVIDGVPGSAAPILLNFKHVSGANCGTLLPTGAARDRIGGIEVSLVDAAMPMVLIAARSLGLDGGEDADFFSANRDLMQQIERTRIAAGRRMGLGDVSDRVVPKVGIVSAPTGNGAIRSRYLTPHTLHAAHAVTGGICVATAACLPGTVANDVAAFGPGKDSQVSIEHPSGTMTFRIELHAAADSWIVSEAAVVRTARKIMSGVVYADR